MFKHYLCPPAIAGALLPLIIFCTGIIAQKDAPPAKTYEPAFALVEQYPTPVIDRTSPGAEGSEYGFEDGRVVKIEGTYHMVTTEMLAGQMWVKTRIAHWTSPDRIHWQRISTLFASSGDFTGQDPRASFWGPMPVYNLEEGRWDLIYVAYRCAPNTKTEYRKNYEGRIWRAVSKQQGYRGIGGPYEDVGVLLEPDANSQPWEGLQGTDSFFPYQVGKRWLGFYGSANTEHLPVEHLRVGLAEAPALAGPWKRMSGINPLNIESHFIENPIVTRLENGYYVIVYDSDVSNAIGWAWSAPDDGVHWTRGSPIVVQPKGTGFWANDVRTPLGLIPEGHGLYTVFYTGYQKPPVSGPHVYSPVGFVTLKDASAMATGAGRHQ
jgi:hypothetical protein